jgi:hypothetical protein
MSSTGLRYVRRYLSIVTTQQNLVWPRNGAISDQTLEKFAYSGRSDCCGKGYNRRLRPAQGWCISLTNSPDALLGC